MDIPDDAIAQITSFKADLRLLEKVQQRMKELVHSYKCMRVANRCGRNICKPEFVNCKNTKKLLEHIVFCEAALADGSSQHLEVLFSSSEIQRFRKPYCRKHRNQAKQNTVEVAQNCPEPLCSSSRQIFAHWIRCLHLPLQTRRSCPLCTLPPLTCQALPKDWQIYMTIEERNHLTDLLQQMIPRSDTRTQQGLCDSPEWIVFQQLAKADSRAEFYRLVAEAVWRLEMETVEKRARCSAAVATVADYIQGKKENQQN